MVRIRGRLFAPLKAIEQDHNELAWVRKFVGLSIRCRTRQSSGRPEPGRVRTRKTDGLMKPALAACRLACTTTNTSFCPWGETMSQTQPINSSPRSGWFDLFRLLLRAEFGRGRSHPARQAPVETLERDACQPDRQPGARPAMAANGFDVIRPIRDGHPRARSRSPGMGAPADSRPPTTPARPTEDELLRRGRQRELSGDAGDRAVSLGRHRHGKPGHPVRVSRRFR
jgi:hypothetical protein